MAKWTRDIILKEILAREAAGRPLTLGAEDGVPHAFYQAASRIFGSWTNAVRTAGVASKRASSHERWTPGRILSVIRTLSRQPQPLKRAEVREKYGYLVPAARKCFGSWAKAVMAAGVDPQLLRQTPSWTKERVLEAILTRALHNLPLGRRTAQPRALVDAGTRLFGGWKAALSAAGVDPNARDDSFARPNAPFTAAPIGMSGVSTSEISRAGTADDSARRTGRWWSDEQVISAIRRRLASGRSINATAIATEDAALYSAARRRYGNWATTLRAAGFDPKDHFRRGGGSPESSC